MITQFIIFVLAATGITLVLVKSKLFKGLREVITLKHSSLQNNIDLSGKPKRRVLTAMWWFVDTVLNCTLCMGVWASGLCVFFVWIKLWIVLWWLAGITIVGLLTKIYDRWMC